MPLPLSLHVAQFYQDAEFLDESISHFVTAGLQGNESVIIIATASHGQTLRHALRPDQLSSEWLTFFDAAELLSEIMVDGWPNSSVFMRILGQPIQVAAQKGRVRVYGEMVAVLCSNGQYQAALCLEGLWNMLQTIQPFALLHAYPQRMYAVTSEVDPATWMWLAIYHAHSHVCHQDASAPPMSTFN